MVGAGCAGSHLGRHSLLAVGGLRQLTPSIGLASGHVASMLI